MNYSLSDFKGHYHSMPNIVAHFLPSNEYMVLLQIYIASHKCLYSGSINVSLRNLASTTSIHRNTITRCIENLQQLNLIRTSITSKKNTEFRINWQEIYALEKYASTVTYDGLDAVRKICFTKSGCKAFSEINTHALETIKQKFPYKQSGTNCDIKSEIVPDEENELRSSGTIFDKIEKFVPDAIANGMTTGAILAEIVKMTPVDDNEYPNIGTFLAKLLDFVPVDTNTSITGTNNDKNADFVPVISTTIPSTGTNYSKNTEIVPVVCNTASHYITKVGKKFVVNVMLSNAERYLMELTGENAFEVQFSTGTNSALFNQTGTNCDTKSAEIVPDASTTGTTVVPQIRYKENKENGSGQRPLIVGEEKETVVENENDDEPSFVVEGSWNNFLDFLFKGLDNIQGLDELPVIDENNLGDFSESSTNVAGLTPSYSSKEDWKEFRDLSYPSYEAREFESIIEDRNFNNTDEDKLIQLVWDYLSSSEHEEAQDNVEEQEQQPDIVPVNDFYRNLYNIWSELKEQDNDFQLSEKEARNIFGFDVIQYEGEWNFVISSSKIKKLIKDEPQPSRERSSRNRGNRGVNGRASIRAFLDALTEIGDKDFQLLTKVEKAIYSIDQYSKEGRVVCESGFVREPHATINSVNLPVKKKEWVEISGMDEQDFNELLDGYKHKGGVYTLHATKLSPDFIISFNEKYDEESEVEKRWSEKMAELS